MPDVRTLPSVQDVQAEDTAPEQEPQEASHVLQEEEVESKYEDLGQYSTHRPLERTGRLAGHEVQPVAEGLEHVAQSGWHVVQVPFDTADPVEQVDTQDPEEA